MEYVLLFPGQGSQKPGMGSDLATAYPAARAAFATVDDSLGVPLSQLCFAGPAEELTLTHNAQPALFAHGAAVWAVLADRLGSSVRAAAGHSLGEFTAYHAAGALTIAEGARLVRERGRLMYETGTTRQGAMAAILGDIDDTIAAVCAKATAEAGIVVVANWNCPGQLVISGEVAAVERAMTLAKEAGAKRAIRLNVSGAFHSPLMEPAELGLRRALETTTFGDPSFPVYSNVTTGPVASTTEARETLVRQVVNPVRWTDEIRALAQAFPNATFLELGPGTVLAGLVKKIVPGREVISCGTAADVTRVLELAA